MKHSFRILGVLLLILCIAAPVDAIRMKLKVTRINLIDLPQKRFDIIRYETGTGELVAIALDDPDNDVSLSFERQSRMKRGGRNTPESLSKEFFYTPLAFKFLDKENGNNLGFLLVPEYYRWLTHYNSKENVITVKILGTSDIYP